MAGPAIAHNNWTDHELDAIVAAYFRMLAAELAGRRYVKRHHANALLLQTGRSRAAIEYKLQNVSAVLDELGLPWIAGYLPRINYQKAIFQAIDRYLSANPAMLHFLPVPPNAVSNPQDVFVPPPRPASHVPSLHLSPLVQKFDPLERDLRNRELGRLGEQFVCEIERRRLTIAGRRDLAANVRWIAAEHGDGAGYDVLSYDPRVGCERLIEVKTTNGSARTPFYLTRNEL
jgi:hypothetical protein